MRRTREQSQSDPCEWDQRIPNEQVFKHFILPLPQPPAYLIARPSSTYFCGRAPDSGFYVSSADASLLNFNADADTAVKPYSRPVFRDTIQPAQLEELQRNNQAADRRARAIMASVHVPAQWDINTSVKLKTKSPPQPQYKPPYIPQHKYQPHPKYQPPSPPPPPSQLSTFSCEHSF
jgi:hypothetical protein